MLEEFIEGELEQRIENFCMKDFIKGKKRSKEKIVNASLLNLLIFPFVYIFRTRRTKIRFGGRSL